MTTSLVLIAIGLAKADGAPGTSREAPKSGSPAVSVGRRESPLS